MTNYGKLCAVLHTVPYTVLLLYYRANAYYSIRMQITFRVVDDTANEFVKVLFLSRLTVGGCSIRVSQSNFRAVRIVMQERGSK